MARIDQQTVQRIIDTADIVEVVSDFVSLKRRGANYVGLCPFHNERTPSFSVNRARGFCYCFSCHKGGGPVNFLMELEQLSYVEALRYLAKKYNIEIKEEAETEDERREASERQSMFEANEFAMQHFEHNMHEVQDGRDIGLAYFRERGINDAAARTFHLGYALDRSTDLLDAARRRGISDQALTSTGLEILTENGRLYDRFKGRVIYPVLSLSGKVVAFGGRTLRKDKDTSKYVNSPESRIYSKSRELYGLYQARRAIAKKDCCILVEGYMDVISMHQSGIENVVASSGTALTEGQIRLIHRFTPNIIVIYDSDAAGVKASLRSIDLLLAEGMSMKIVSLPQGEDPDSFAQSHSASEVEEYLATHQVDIVDFKNSILTQGRDSSDPLVRASVVQDILSSVAFIPDQILRQAYLQKISARFDMPESMLSLQIDRIRADKAIADSKQAAQEQNRAAFERSRTEEKSAPTEVTAATTQTHGTSSREDKRRQYFCAKPERALLALVLRYGMLQLCEVYDAEGNSRPMSVIEYVESEFAYDSFCFSMPDLLTVWHAAAALAHDEKYTAEYKAFADKAQDETDLRISEGISEIAKHASDVEEIHRRELELRDNAANDLKKSLDDFRADYISKVLLNSADDTVRRLTAELVCDRQPLSKIHSKYTVVPGDRDRLAELVPGAMSALKNAILECEYASITDKLAHSSYDDPEEYLPLLKRQQQLKETIKEMAHYLGDRIIPPRYKF